MKKATIHHAYRSETLDDIWTTVTLAYDDRHRRRIKMIADNQEAFLLDLPQATYLSEGDLLELDDGGFIQVKAAIEEVLEVTCQHVEMIARVSWHIGNRHTPVEVCENGVLRLRYDHVLHEMIEGLGASCIKKLAPFSPEPGAYKSGGGHGHAHL